MAPAYKPPLAEYRFLLKDVFCFDDVLESLFPDLNLDSDLALTVLEEAGRFCRDVLQPINANGDHEGCTFQDGVVKTPAGFPDAYRAFADAGWCSLSAPREFGGQGLPQVLQQALDEMVSSCNVSFGLFPGLTRGAVEALSKHATEELKTTYLPRMVNGEWTGVMALTESAAGSDLGLLKTQARANADGSYTIAGSKIFISSGDHDFGGNIIHLVLARLPDAPAGSRGISLFLVPKFLVDEKGHLGDRNRVTVGALEDKMGIHAQPTCAMDYDGAVGWLVGEANRGLNAMFTMMNAERLFVGMQGLGLADSAYQAACAHALERLQGRLLNGTQIPCALIEHPDVRRMLLTIRAFVEAARALAVWVALQMDVAARHPDPETCKSADGFVSLMTPVVKAAFTDFGFESAVLGQQIFGGHGYIRQTGAEQIVRDSRIAQIYEGTNGIQALDLVSRKLALEGGHLASRLFALIGHELEEVRVSGHCQGIVEPVQVALSRLEAATARLQNRAGDSAEMGAAATDYLQFLALVALGWMWARQVDAAAKCSSGTHLSSSKRAVARFFVDKMLPRTAGLAACIDAGGASTMSLASAAF